MQRHVARAVARWGLALNAAPTLAGDLALRQPATTTAVVVGFASTFVRRAGTFGKDTSSARIPAVPRSPRAALSSRFSRSDDPSDDPADDPIRPAPARRSLIRHRPSIVRRGQGRRDRRPAPRRFREDSREETA
jgi:hypothetical protein